MTLRYRINKSAKTSRFGFQLEAIFWLQVRVAVFGYTFGYSNRKLTFSEQSLGMLLNNLEYAWHLSPTPNRQQSR